MQLTNKTIVITGASQGLGKSIAFKTAALGALVILVSRNEKLLKEVKEKIISDGFKAEYFVCDIRNHNETEVVAKKILDTYKSIDFLVNNAGVWTDNKINKVSKDSRVVALETNILGHIQFTDKFLEHFKDQNKGYIFNVISTSGIAATAGSDNSFWHTYGATKWAMHGFTNALKDSVKGSKVKVTGFFPGGFDSNLYENAGRENPHNQPWMMKTEDVADIVVFALTRPDDVALEQIVVTKVL